MPKVLHPLNPIIALRDPDLSVSAKGLISMLRLLDTEDEHLVRAIDAEVWNELREKGYLSDEEIGAVS